MHPVKNADNLTISPTNFSFIHFLAVGLQDPPIMSQYFKNDRVKGLCKYDVRALGGKDGSVKFDYI